jgi:hypothetical protein
MQPKTSKISLVNQKPRPGNHGPVTDSVTPTDEEVRSPDTEVAFANRHE